MSPFAHPPAEQERIGIDGRRAVADTWAVPYRWICSLRTTYPTGPARRGTGLLVGPRQVLTAAHCLYRGSDGAAPTTIEVIPGRDGRVFPVGTFTTSAFSVPPAFLTPRPGSTGKVRAGSAVDIAIITLDRDIDRIVPPGRPAGQPLGHWGHPRFGHRTRMRALGTGYLDGKQVTVCGYPTDRCGRAVRGGTCDRRDFASVPFLHYGTVSLAGTMPGFLLYDADTFEGQSGAPVWVRTTDGSRYLAGIHLGARVQRDVKTGLRLPVTANKARHLDADTVTLIRSWMPRAAVQGTGSGPN